MPDETFAETVVLVGKCLFWPTAMLFIASVQSDIFSHTHGRPVTAQWAWPNMSVRIHFTFHGVSCIWVHIDE